MKSGASSSHLLPKVRENSIGRVQARRNELGKGRQTCISGIGNVSKLALGLLGVESMAFLECEV